MEAQGSSQGAYGQVENTAAHQIRSIVTDGWYFLSIAWEHAPADKQEQDRHDDSNFRISECLEKNKRNRRSQASVKT